ncbi:MAG: primosomal protein N' [Clostridia bacterium]|nr:primosomal protein N' [Clostridia bacterium]
MVVGVIVNSTAKVLNRVFDYIVPKDLEEKIKIGDRVSIPFGNSKKLQEGFIYEIKQESEFAVKEIVSIEKDGLNEEGMKLAKLMSRMYFCNIFDCIKLMLPPGTSTKIVENRIKDKKGNFVYLNKDIEEIEQEIADGVIKSPKQIRVLEFLKDNEGVYISDLEMYTDTSKAIIKTLEKNEYIQIVEENIDRNPFILKDVPRDKKLPLNEEQFKAFEEVNKSIEDKEFKEFLLYGVTGSGKTEVYLQLIEKVLEKGKTAIMLVPEISLTPQMVNRFLARFGNCIAVLHSKLSIGERYDAYKKIKNGEIKIVIGARSAIFAPVKNIGILIIDEEHDSSYKSEMNPRYNAKDIARYICKSNNAPLLLGSATPDLNTFYNAKNEKIELLTLTKRANSSNLPDVEIVDLREELAKGNKSMISEKLKTYVEENLKNKKQTILFLNRRGFSTFVMCRNCGFTAKCKNCNITLTYHKNTNKLKCHYCGFETKNITVCPICGSKNVRYFGAGTQKLEEEVHKMFPECNTIRMDVDTVTKKNSHEEILEKFKNENIDILIGTQMVVKGHHFPNVTLVGVIAADSSLNIEDFRAGERTFQILTQVAGRAGREQLPGKVVVQTYNKDNYSIEFAKEQNYDLFYNAEIMMRKSLNYPPFCDIIQFSINSKSDLDVKKVAKYIYNELKKEFNIIKNNILIFEPVPAPIDKIKNNYRWRILVKCRFNNRVIDLINNVLERYYKKNFKNTRLIIDVNPNNMM